MTQTNPISFKISVVKNNNSAQIRNFESKGKTNENTKEITNAMRKDDSP